jgi:Lipid A 3-O-deacylase (PagL)
MHTPGKHLLRVAMLLAAYGSCTLAARAADVPLALGAVYGYGDHTNIYGVQASWAPPKDNEFLDRYDLGLRLTAQIARWVARDGQARYHSLTDANVMSELRYWITSPGTVRPFVEAGFGFDLLSHVHIAEQNMTTAFNFGSQAAVGLTFGDNGRYEISALIHHASNASIKQPNDGLTYGAIRFRVALP